MSETGQDRQTGQDNGLIAQREPFYKRSPKNRGERTIIIAHSLTEPMVHPPTDPRTYDGNDECSANISQDLCFHTLSLPLQWRQDWISVSVVNSHLVVDPPIRQPSFDLARRQ